MNQELCPANSLNKKRLQRFTTAQPQYVQIQTIYPYIKNPNKIPAATAEPMTPDTFGPIACINR